MSETTDPLVAFGARIRAMRWLKPDASTETLSAEAREQMIDRVSEHFAALCALGEREAPTERPVVHFTRSMTEANTRWESSWSEALAPEALWHVTLLESVRREVVPQAGDPTGALGRATQVVTKALRASTPPLPVVLPGTQVTHRTLELLPALATLTAHAAYIAARPEPADGSRSPWYALVELWDLGVWPMILPGGEFLIYVPVQDAQGIVPDTDKPSVRELPRRVPVGATEARSIPPLHRLGVGPGPCIFPLPPVFETGPPVGEPLGPAMPMDFASMPTGGAPMPVAPMPPDIPWMRSPPKPPVDEPWYKRLARKIKG